MNTAEIASKAERLKLINAEIKTRDEQTKQLKKEADGIVQWLAGEFRDNMIAGELNLDGLRVNAGYEMKYSVKGGDVEDPERKTPLVDLLVDSGFLDAEKVQKITDGRSVNASSLQAAIRKAAENAPAIIETLQSQELLTSYLAPFAKVK